DQVREGPADVDADPVHGSAPPRAAAPARSSGHDPVGEILGAGPGRAPPGRAVAAAPRRLDQEDVAGEDRHPDRLRLERPRPSLRHEPVAVGRPLGGAEEAVGGVPYPFARRVGPGGRRRLHPELEDGAEATPEPAVAARVGSELVAREEERKAGLRHLDAPELDAAGRLALAPRPPPLPCPGGAPPTP